MSLALFGKGFKEGMHDFGQTLTSLINAALLTFVYILGVGLTSIISKIVRKHFLDRSFSNKKSYWEPLNLKKKKFEEYYRQF